MILKHLRKLKIGVFDQSSANCGFFKGCFRSVHRSRAAEAVFKPVEEFIAKKPCLFPVDKV